MSTAASATSSCGRRSCSGTSARAGWPPSAATSRSTPWAAGCASSRASRAAAAANAARAATTSARTSRSSRRHPSTAEIPLALVQNRELWLTGTFRYANTYPTAIELAASGRVDVAALITGHYRLEDTETALRAGYDDDASIKVMVHPRSPPA
jgi:threonine dehydrogenase-like Zn-dependent dehydrogenase